MRPNVPLQQCWGHHGDGWRDDPWREREGDYVGEATKLYNNCLCTVGGVAASKRRCVCLQ